MKITEVRIFPTESKDGKLKAFATMTFDDWFVVRNVKVIQGNNGFFVAMPSRKAMIFCPKCRFKNVVGSKYCNQCGAEMGRQEAVKEGGDEKHNNHMDIAHPISQECRVYIQDKILEAFNSQAGQHSEKSAFVRPEKTENKAPEEVKAEPEKVPEEVKAEPEKVPEEVKPEPEKAPEEKQPEAPYPIEPTLIDDSQDIAL